MGATVKILPHYTFEDYCNWEGKWELIEGIPYAMSPAPLPNHGYISSNVNIEFGIALKAAKCKKCIASHPVDIKIAEDTIVQPDFLIYCGTSKKPLIDVVPKLVVEVLSPSTVLKDRHTKFKLYQDFGIKYFLIISTETETLQVFCLEDGNYQLKQEGHDFTYRFDFEEDCSFEIDFNEIW